MSKNERNLQTVSLKRVALTDEIQQLSESIQQYMESMKTVMSPIQS